MLNINIKKAMVEGSKLPLPKNSAKQDVIKIHFLNFVNRIRRFKS